MFSSLGGSVRDWVALLPKPAKVAAAALAVLLVALAGFRLVAGGGNSSAPGPPRAAARAQTAPAGEGATMLRRDGNAVVGVLHTNDGAAAAALSYVQQRNALLTGGTTSREAAEVGSKIAIGGRDVGDNPASIPDRVAVESGDALLRTRVGQTGWWTVPFGYAVRSYGTKTATVRVFSSLLSVDLDVGQGPGAMAFSLLDVRLRWQDGAWRISDVADAPDQPAPVFAFGVNTRSDATNLPIKDRVIRSSETSSVPLARWLQGATPVLSGPQGMGPAENTPPANEDAAAILRDASAGTAALAKSAGVLTGGKGKDWHTNTPIAYRPASCPAGLDAGRCYYALLVGTGTEDDGVASVQLGLAGYALSGSGAELQVNKLEIPLEEQTAILGGQLNVPRAEDDERRTGLAAWQRSIVPLRPAIPAVPR